MKKVILKNFKHESRTIEQLDVFVHDDDSLILLPSLYSLFLSFNFQRLPGGPAPRSDSLLRFQMERD